MSQYPSTYLEYLPNVPALHSYLRQWDLLEVEDEVVYRRWFDESCDGWNLVMVAPARLRREVFHHLRELGTGGQFGRLGVTRNTKKLRRQLYWPGLQNDLRTWRRWCITCAKRKPSHGRHRAIYTKAKSWYSTYAKKAFHILGPLPRTEYGNEYCIVCHVRVR